MYRGCDKKAHAVRRGGRDGETWGSFRSREKEMKERVHVSGFEAARLFMSKCIFMFSASLGY